VEGIVTFTVLGAISGYLDAPQVSEA